MSEERESTPAGSPVEEDPATHTEVLAAVERAGGPSTPSETVERAPAEPGDAPRTAAEPTAPAASSEDLARVFGRDTSSSGVDTQPHADRPVIAEREELPSAGASGAPSLAADAAAGTVDRGFGAAPASRPAPELSPVRDGEIRISADHPMASLYVQTPMPPEMRGNRGAGVLIALLATICFAAVYAGALALWLAPSFPPSTFLTEGLLPMLLTWGFIGSVVAFFVGLALLVLIMGRAGWWAYVLGGFLVAVLVWAAAALGYSAQASRVGVEFSGWHPTNLLGNVGLWLPVVAAGLVAREVSVWFGAWIGARGRRVRLRNAAALAEYDAAMAEVQATQP